MLKRDISSFENEVYNLVKLIPKAKVTTYKEIALAISSPRAYRAVGNALNKNPFIPEVPCHRVVRSDGVIGGYAGGINKKIKLLQGEGVKCFKGRVMNLNHCLFKFSDNN